MPVHAGADSDNRYVGPHWTTTPGYEVAKAADACGTCCEGRKSCTELLETETLRKEGGKLGSDSSLVFKGSYMTYIL